MDFLVIATILAASLSANAKVYLKEEFTDGDAFAERWVSSTAKGAEMGVFRLSAGKFYNDEETDKGLQTSQDARFYGISTKFESFSNEGKPLVIQFQVKHEQGIDCGGGYVKVFGSDLDQAGMHGDSPYHIMFGPDICGSTKRVHVIFAYKGTNHLVKKEISCKEDVFSHLYTLIVKPDNTYQVKIDGTEVQSGTLEDDWDMLPSKEILDPEQSKPADWVDNEMIPDPEDTKPEDWDKPQHIPDAGAAKPSDWDDDMDGEWEAPMIDNPEYKGEWKPKEIVNPDYKGPWVHPKVPNPEYVHDAFLYRYADIGAIGLDLWQVKSGSIFDNFLITDDPAEAEAFAQATFEVTTKGEKKMKEAQDEAEKQKEAADAAKEDDDDDEDEDEEEVGGEDGAAAEDADAVEEDAEAGGQTDKTESHDEL